MSESCVASGLSMEGWMKAQQEANDKERMEQMKQQVSASRNIEQHRRRGQIADDIDAAIDTFLWAAKILGTDSMRFTDTELGTMVVHFTGRTA